MFGTRVEEQIREEIRKQTGIELSKRDVHEMRVVPVVSRTPCNLILCLQVGKQTLLAPVKISDDGQHLLIGEIKIVNW